MKLVLIGPPGSGKGTQALKLKEQYGIPHLSSGDVLRAQVAAGTEFGKKIKVYMDRGEIGPAELITEVILHHLGENCPGGFILDGFPRTLYQADKLSGQHRIDAALFIDVSEKEITSRITGRRICRNCNRIFHEKTNPPKTADRCDACGSPLYHRPDDNEETVVNRIRVYNDETRPVLDFYNSAGLLRTINGERDTEVIFREIVGLLG
ncbi:MAG TPA: nucleoside monophosphate kinase [Spirochaetota bacterium]|nr:nucleoside monophosphate kinase [Spirochaetota bacterium]